MFGCRESKIKERAELSVPTIEEAKCGRKGKRGWRVDVPEAGNADSRNVRIIWDLIYLYLQTNFNNKSIMSPTFNLIYFDSGRESSLHDYSFFRSCFDGYC